MGWPCSGVSPSWQFGPCCGWSVHRFDHRQLSAPLLPRSRWVPGGDLLAGAWLTLPLLGWLLLLPRGFNPTGAVASALFLHCQPALLVRTDFFVLRGAFLFRRIQVALQHRGRRLPPIPQRGIREYLGFVSCRPEFRCPCRFRRDLGLGGSKVVRGNSGIPWRSCAPGWAGWPGVVALVGAILPLGLIAGSLTGVLTSPLDTRSWSAATARSTKSPEWRPGFFYGGADSPPGLRGVLPNDAPGRSISTRAPPPGRDGDEVRCWPDSLERRISGDPDRPRLERRYSSRREFRLGVLGLPGPDQHANPRDGSAGGRGRDALHEPVCFRNRRFLRYGRGPVLVPPLPGESIVKRDHSDHVETIARLLQRDGY